MPDAAAGFVLRILDDPADALPRLVFADWLDESGGDAGAVWARYLRLRARAATDPNPVDREVARAEADVLGPRVEARLSVPAAPFAGNVRAILDLLPAANVTMTVDGFNVHRPALGWVTEEDADRCRGLPLAKAGGCVLLGMVDPTDGEAVGNLLGRAGGSTAVAVRVPGDQLAELVHRTFTRVLALPAPNTGEGVAFVTDVD